MENVSIPALIKEAIFLNDTLSDPEGRLSKGKDKERAVFHVKAFLEKASPYMSSDELRPSLDKLRENCSLMRLGESDVKIQRFVNPILKLPDHVLNTVVGFLEPGDLHKVAVTSNPLKPSLARLSDREKLIRISSGMPVRDLGLTEKSLLSLIRRNEFRITENEGITIKCLNLNGMTITEIRSLLDLCPEIHSLSAVDCRFNSGEAGKIASYENIRELDLGINLLGDVGAEHISKMSGLRSLELRDNQIGPLGAEYISKMDGLATLGLAGNKIGTIGTDYISNMDGLKRLILIDCGISASLREQIRQKLEARGGEVFF